MNATLIFGTRIVILALLAYSIAVITEQRTRTVSNIVVTFLTLGIVFDVTATVFMIMGSPNSPFTVHGFLGYSALLGMLIDFFMLWRIRLTQGAGAEPPTGVHLYSRYAYSWWVIAFITGGLMVALK